MGMFFRPTAATGARRYLSPEQIADDEVNNLTAVVRPAGAPFIPGTYQVTYQRIGQHGRRGAPRPIPLTTTAATLADLNASIADDAELHLDGRTVHVLIDLAVMGGTLRTGSTPAGTFTLRHLTPPGTAPAPAPGLETNDQ